LDEFGIVLDAKKNDAHERLVSSGRVKVLVVPTNEELAIARDTRQILLSLESREAAAVPALAPPPETAPPAAFQPDEVAKLVLLWARNRRASAAVLAEKLGREISRAVEADTVRRELERLSLTAAAGRTDIREKQAKG